MAVTMRGEENAKVDSGQFLAELDPRATLLGDDSFGESRSVLFKFFALSEPHAAMQAGYSVQQCPVPCQLWCGGCARGLQGTSDQLK